MKLTKIVLTVTALAALGGCVAVPVGPGYYASGPAYSAPPVYYGPAIGIGVYGRSYGGGHRRY